VGQTGAAARLRLEHVERDVGAERERLYASLQAAPSASPLFKADLALAPRLHQT
jgi:hypothetical protein